jgi:hypothetical protein
MTQVTCGLHYTGTPAAYEGGVVLEHLVDSTINHCNFSHCYVRKRGAVLFCYRLHEAGVFNASWLTVYSNTGQSIIETLRDSTPRIAYANFIDNRPYDDWAVVYANNWGMILEYCIFKGNQDALTPSHVIFDIYRSTRDDDAPFRLSHCYFDKSPNTNHYAVVIDVVTRTTTRTHEIQHYQNAYCEAQIPYQSATFTDTANFKVTTPFSQSRTLPSPTLSHTPSPTSSGSHTPSPSSSSDFIATASITQSGPLKQTAPILPSGVLPLTEDYRATRSIAPSAEIRITDFLSQTQSLTASGVWRLTNGFTPSFPAEFSEHFDDSVQISGSVLLKPSLPIRFSDDFADSVLLKPSIVFPISRTFLPGSLASLSVAAVSVSANSDGSDSVSTISFALAALTQSSFFFATALSALTGFFRPTISLAGSRPVPLSAQFSLSGPFSVSSQLVNSAGIKASPGFGFTRWFGLSETLTSQLSAFTTTSESDSQAASGIVSEVSTSLVDYSRPTIVFSLTSGVPNSIAFLSSADVRSSVDFDASSRPADSVALVETSSFSSSSDVRSSAALGASSQAADSAVIIETGSFSAGSEIDDNASSSSASVAVGAEDGTEGFEGTAVFGHSPVFAGSRSGFDGTALLKDSAAFGASSSASSSAAFTASATLSKKAAAQTTSAATWTVAGIGLLFLVVLAAVLVWFFVFHRRTEDSEPSAQVEEDPGVTTTDITMEEVEGDFENLNPLASSDGEALFTIALQGE